MDHTRRIAEASLGISILSPEVREPETGVSGQKADDSGQKADDSGHFPLIHHAASFI